MFLVVCFDGSNSAYHVSKEIRYDMTIEDPDTFAEPWVMPTRVVRAGGGDGIIPERSYCEVYETGDVVTQLRH